jgi:Cu+-exporting ATPase
MTSLSYKDPVCGMAVDSTNARGGSHDHLGRTYYFCNPNCRLKFREDPEKYLSPKKEVPLSSDSKPDTRLYTCPMDPEVRNVGPGTCPMCGMALEPLHAADLLSDDWEIIAI